MSSEAGKAERGNKMETTLAEKEAKSVNKSSSCEINTENELKTTAFEIRLGTQQLRKLLPKEIYIFFNVRRQIIAEAKLS